MLRLFKDMRELVENTAHLYREKTAFILKKNKEYVKKSYGDFCADIKALSAALLKKGLGGKRVAVLGVNCYEWCVAYLGVLCAGCVAVPLDNRLFPEEIERLLNRSRADAVIFSKNHAKTMENQENILKICMNGEGFENFSDVLQEGKQLLEQEENLYNQVQIDENALAVLMFTSGTTADAKGVMLSQKNILSNTQDLSEAENFKSTYVYAALVPMHHAFGCGALVLFVASGITFVFPEGLRIAQCLKEYKVSLLVGVPAIYNAMYKKIMQEIEKQGKIKKLETGLKLSKTLMRVGIDMRRKIFKDILESLGGNLQLMISGASAIEPKVAEFFNAIGVTLVQGYGLTETAPVLAAEREQKRRSGSIGFPMLHVQIRVSNPNEKGIGELIAKGPNVMLGYYEAPEATAETLKDGWFFTGDMGYIDKDGYIFITGRKKNVLVLNNGKNVYPEELEQLIEHIPGVKENLVYLKTMDNGKEQLRAKIVYDTEIYADDEAAYDGILTEIKKMNTTLVGYKQIRDILVTKTPMAKTTTAKIKRNIELAKIEK